MKKSLDTKDLMEFKFSMTDDTADKGVFTGYASVFGVIDSYGDIVVPGAFKKTLKENNPVPMLWNHSVDQPIGLIHLTEEERGLKAEGHLNLDVARAQEIRSLMKQGAVKGLSIGYQTVKDSIDKTTNARLLKEVKLWEVSPVVFPANTAATISSVKSADESVVDGRPWLLEPVEAKPYPNEHACRLEDPGSFEEFRRGVRKHEGKEYSVIFGRKGESTWSEQAYRYAKDVWTADEAKTHCADHDGTFEAAEGKCDDCRMEMKETEPDASTPPDDTNKPDSLHLLEIHRLRRTA